jgi:YD repeat-containing protein
VEGITYDQLTSTVPVSGIVTASDNDAADPAQESLLLDALNSFRKQSALSGKLISTYTYDPLIGVTSITPPSGVRQTYTYDSANRLKETGVRGKNSAGSYINKKCLKTSTTTNHNTNMRKYSTTKAFSLLGLSIAAMSFAQSQNENYVQSRSCLNDDCSRKSETITYFDGLGRPKQIISVKATPGGKDLVTPVTYDGFGRQVKNILPVPAATQNSSIHTGITDETAANSYYGVSNAYSEKEMENSRWTGYCSRQARESHGR